MTTKNKSIHHIATMIASGEALRRGDLELARELATMTETGNLLRIPSREAVEAVKAARAMLGDD